MRELRNIPLILIVILSMVLGFSTLTRGHEWGDDWAWYVLQAKSVLDGTTKEFMDASEFTNTQSTTHVGPLAYPWGYPLILTPMVALKGTHPLALKLPGLFFYAGFLICLYHLTKPRLTRTESLLVVSLFAFNPMLIRFLDQILSDIPFLFFSTLTLLLMTQNSKRGTLQFALIGTSIFLTTFLRATGILLLAGFLIIGFFRFWSNRKDREMVKEFFLGSLVVCSVFAFLWVVNSLLFPSGGESYLSQYAGLSLETVKGFTSGYFRVFSVFLGEAQGWMYLYYVVVLFFLLGAWTRRRDEPIFILFFILWLIVHITYPYWQGPRYIFPLLPIFIYFTFQGMKFATSRLPESHQQLGQRVFYGFWLLMVGYFLLSASGNAYANLRADRQINGPFDPYSRQVYEYIKERTTPDSVVVFFKPRVMILMTGHDTIMSTECDRMYLGDYIVLSRKVGENQQITPEEIGTCNLPLDEILKNNRFIVYEIQE
jgi:hypothetical protein